MNNYKTHCLTVIIFLAFITVARSNEGFAVKNEMEIIIQDTIPKQRSGNSKNETKIRDRAKTDRQDRDVIKSVPRARRQAKPNIVKPKLDAIRKVRPVVKPNIKPSVKVKL